MDMNTNSQTITLHATSEADTDFIAHRFVECIPNSTTIALTGTLGAGKTRFVQGVAVALGGNASSITSPTFVICNQYLLSQNVFHLDAYRIKDEDEFLELGVDEMYLSDGYTFIEWAEKFERCLPREYIGLTIEINSETGRTFIFSGTNKYASVLEALTAACPHLAG